VSLLPPTITTLSSSFLVLNAFFPLKKETSNYRYCKCSAFTSYAILHLFLNSNSVNFVEGGRKNISFPRVQGTLATPLHVQFLKIAIKAMPDAKKISPLARKVLEVPKRLEINFSTIEVSLHCSFHPEKTSLYHSLMGEIYSIKSR